MDCGCQVNYGVADQHSTVGYKDVISFCPTHANAPRMKEALEQITTHCSQFKGGVFNVQGISFLAHDALSPLKED